MICEYVPLLFLAWYISWNDSHDEIVLMGLLLMLCSALWCCCCRCTRRFSSYSQRGAGWLMMWWCCIQQRCTTFFDERATSAPKTYEQSILEIGTLYWYVWFLDNEQWVTMCNDLRNMYRCCSELCIYHTPIRTTRKVLLVLRCCMTLMRGRCQPQKPGTFSKFGTRYWYDSWRVNRWVTMCNNLRNMYAYHCCSELGITHRFAWRGKCCCFAGAAVVFCSLVLLCSLIFEWWVRARYVSTIQVDEKAPPQTKMNSTK